MRAPPPATPTAVALALTLAGLAGCAGDDPAGEGCAPAPASVVLAAEERRLPVVSAAPDGTAVAAWETITGDPVEAAVRVPGGGWGAAAAVTERYASRPRTAALPGGRGVLVWQGRSPGGGTAARWAERGPGGAWTAPRDLGPAGGEGRWWPDAAAWRGRVAAAWSAGGAGLWVRDRDASGRWGPPRETGLAGEEVLDLRIAAGPVDALAWLEVRGEGRVVRAAVRRPGAGWGPARDLSPPGTANDPRVVAAPDGRVTVTWRRDTTGDRQVVEAADHRAGRWSVMRIAGEAPRGRGLPRPPGAGSLAPEPSAGADGRAVVAWPRREGTRERAMVALRPAGGAWGAPREVTGSDESGSPDTALAGGRVPVVAWEDLDGVRLTLRVGRAGPGGVVCCARPGRDGREVAAPVLAALPGGRVLVLWNGSNHGSIEAAEIAPC